MAHPMKQDSGLIEILQASSIDGDDLVSALLRHTIHQMLEAEHTAFLRE